MTLGEQITDDMKNAMKSGDKQRLETLRSLRAALLELDKSGEKVTDEAQLQAVMKQGKRRKDAIEQYTNVGRTDLAEKEAAELKIIEEYLPKQLGEDDIRNAVLDIIQENNATSPDDFKVVMPKAMGTLRGQADGATVQAIVKEELAKLVSE